MRGTLFEDLKPTTEPVRVQKILAPLVPSQIFCTGLNYRRHAEETRSQIPERPILFMKGVNALQHPGDPIQLPRHCRSDKVDYECELAIVIGKACRNATMENALDFVGGYCCANDVSARDHQKHWGGGQWCRGKTFDTFLPLGPCLVTPDEIPNPDNLRIRTLLNGEPMQDSNTSDMIFSVASLIVQFSGSTTLPPGTVLLTGTPEGVGMAIQPEPRFLKPGDEVTIEIEKIGSLTNPVVEEPV